MIYIRQIVVQSDYKNAASQINPRLQWSSARCSQIHHRTDCYSKYVGFQYQTSLKRVYVICTELKKKYYFEEEKKRVLKSK